jgi:glycerol-3-phosphate dehydrogenase
LPYLKAEAIYAVRHEMVRSLDDVLSRRTRARLFDREASVRAAEEVAALIAPELGWTENERRRQVEAYRESCALEEAATLAATSPSVLQGSGASPTHPDGDT